MRSYLIAFNPTDEAKRPKREKAAKAMLSGEDFATLLDRAEGGRLYAPILLILATGLRRGELLALRWRNTHLDEGYLLVIEAVEETKVGLRVKQPKTDTGQRRVDLPDFAVQAIRDHMLGLKQEHLALGLGWTLDTLVFPTPPGELWRPRNFTKAVTRLASSAGIHFTPHLGRHDHLTRLLTAGVHPKIAQLRAGHSSISTTMDIYSHATGNLQHAATEQMEHAFQEIRKYAGGNRVAKPLPSPKGDVVSI